MKELLLFIEQNDVVISAIIIVTGWFINSWLTSRRSVRGDQRKVKTSHLIDSYRGLVNDVIYREPSIERSLKLESIIGAIQLFGTEEQITLAKKY